MFRKQVYFIIFCYEIEVHVHSFQNKHDQNHLAAKSQSKIIDKKREMQK